MYFLGVERRVGTSRKTGAEYDFTVLRYAVPFLPFTGQTSRTVGSGWSVVEVRCSAPVSDFADIEPGDAVSLRFAPDPRDPQRVTCTGVDGG